MILKMLKDVTHKFRDHPNRFGHIIGVTQTALKLAQVYGIEPRQAYIAAMFHDYTKYDTIEQQKSMLTADEIKKYQNMPVVYHALSAASYVKNTYEIKEDVILDAIKCHVFGRVHMTTLDKIVLIADKTEPSRNYSLVEDLRKLSFTNLDEAIKTYLIDLKDYHQGMHPDQKQMIDQIINSLGE